MINTRTYWGCKVSETEKQSLKRKKKQLKILFYYSFLSNYEVRNQKKIDP